MSKIFSKERQLIFGDIINIASISYSYDNTRDVLNNISLKIYKGDHIGIYGETGSGKSTLLDIMMGLLVPKKGNILIDKIDIFQNKYQHY